MKPHTLTIMKKANNKLTIGYLWTKKGTYNNIFFKCLFLEN